VTAEPTTERRRRLNGERARRSRRRRARGRAIFRVEGDETEVVMTLIASGRLSEDEALQHAAVEKALSEMTADWIVRWRERMRHA
jgi:hypothetical protein